MYKRRVAEVFLDFCLAALCYYTAYRLRFEDPEEFMKNFSTFRVSLPVILASQMIAFFIVGVYPRRLAALRPDGFDRHRPWRAVWNRRRPALHPLRLPLLRVFTDRLRHLRHSAADGRDPVAGIVPDRGGVRAAPAPIRPAASSSTAREMRAGS
jgi:hypothetical protein